MGTYYWIQNKERLKEIEIAYRDDDTGSWSFIGSEFHQTEGFLDTYYILAKVANQDQYLNSDGKEKNEIITNITDPDQMKIITESLTALQSSIKKNF